MAGSSSYATDSNHSNRVQQCTLFLSATMIAFLAVLIALTAATYSRIVNQQVTLTSITTPYAGLGLPGYETLAWNDVVSAAAGQTVTFSTCASCARYNKMIDGFLIPQMKQVYGINVVRYPQAAVDAVAQVTKEMASGNTAKGGIDLIWINLENFANLYTAKLAYGPWVFNVPSIANFNQTDTSVFYDGGLYTAGYEIPYNGAQCAFIYNKKLVTAQADLVNIRTIAGLQTWIVANKGKFTYAAPATDATGQTGDYTGSAFIRHVFYALSGPYTDFLGSRTVNTALYNARAPKTFQYLRAIEPYLYSAPGLLGQKNTYPANNAVVDTLFGQLKIALTLSYDPTYAAAQLANGQWNRTDPQGYILDTGTLANTNYLAIPINSPNKPAALVVANYVANPAAMFFRFQNISALQVFDPTVSAFTSGGWNTAFSSIPDAPQTPPRALRAAGRLGELSAAYVTQIQADWYTCVVAYTGPSAANPQCG